MNAYLLILLLLVSLFSCKEGTTIKPVVDQTDSASLVISAHELEPAISTADSMELIYYDSLEDSLRYSRYYKFTATSDTTAIRLVVNQLGGSFSIQEQARACRSEGKIHLYSKNEPLKTLYFSRAGARCNYIYFIRNGNFYYFPLRDEFRLFLDKDKMTARKL